MRIGKVARKLRRLGIDGADMEGEDAVDLAFFKLSRALDRGYARRLEDGEGFGLSVFEAPW